jgi:hypothetical protein
MRGVTTMSFTVTLGTNQRDRIDSRQAATRREALEDVAPRLLLEAVDREKSRSWLIGEIIFIKVEPDPAG